MKNENPNIPQSYVQALISCLQQEGPSGLSANLNIWNKISQWREFEELISVAEDAIPQAGIRYGEYLPLTAHGDFGTSVMCARNLEDSLEILVKYSEYRLSIFSVDLTQESHYAWLVFRPRAEVSKHWKFLSETIFSILYRGIRLLTNENANISVVNFDASEPKDYSIRKLYPDVNFNFNQDYFSCGIDKSMLSERISFENEEMLSISIKRIERERIKIEKGTSFGEKASSIVVDSNFSLTFEEVAFRLKLSPRSLRTKLHKEANSFQDLVRSARHTRAIYLLENTVFQIAEIAEKVGYNNASSFTSAFKSWHGESPASYRKNAS